MNTKIQSIWQQWSRLSLALCSNLCVSDTSLSALAILCQCLSVRLLDTVASRRKTDELVAMLFGLWTSVGPGNCVRCIINTTCVHGDAALRLITLTSCFHWKWLLSWCLCECRQLSNTVMTKSYERQCVITNHQCHPAWYRCWWHWLRIRMHLILSGFPWV